MKSAVIVLFAALSLVPTVGATAQTAAPPPAAPLTQDTAPPANPPSPAATPADAAKIAVAVKILQETHTLDNMTSMLDLMTPAMLAAIKRQLPGITDETYKLIAQMLPDEMRADLPKLITMEAQVYAEHFTLEELKVLDGFYQTPTGQKMVTEVPKILRETVPLGMAWGREAGEDAMQRVITKLRAQGVKI